MSPAAVVIVAYSQATTISASGFDLVTITYIVQYRYLHLHISAFTPTLLSALVSLTILVIYLPSNLSRSILHLLCEGVYFEFHFPPGSTYVPFGRWVATVTVV
ncbi:hypothetical protein BKA82DRAFT_4236832 [Pisolithus tinctorius]|nr:hypothetical protein BKA82DRAFT_4236832 [Pisolithus tinctorius]